LKKLIIIVAFLGLVALLFTLWMGMPKGPKLEKVAHLKTPQIITMPDEKVLQVTATGAPDKTAGKAFGLLFNAFFKIKEAPKGGKNFKAPRGRWTADLNTPADQWTGYYAMPVPQSVTKVPKVKETDGLKLELTTWTYGEMAQVLYVGPYDKETPAINAIKDFIEKSGYEISGLHEEEYIRGPGMIFSGDPETYLTLIRYPVRKKQ
jgi:effector-binding domain-containing protein